MKKFTFTSVVASILILVAPITIAQTNNANSTQSKESTSLHSSDQRFINKAATGGLAEVELARLALQKSSNNAVKGFAQHMIDNHTRSNDELARLASQKGITLPTNLDNKHKTIFDKLSQASGSTFDKQYINSQIKDHKVMIKLFNREARIGKDQDLKNFANRTLPTLQEHANLARNIKQQTE